VELPAVEEWLWKLRKLILPGVATDLFLLPSVIKTNIKG
jgi:hypothetical protein